MRDRTHDRCRRAPRSVIGYYVHHQGHGHLHRATAIAAALDQPVTGLSTRPRPGSWTGPWLQLRDDAVPGPTGDPSAYGWLHYVPDAHPGLRARMAAISGWIEATDPDLLISDVSVEVALLARLHGVPVLTVGMPGERLDRAHQLGYGVSARVIGAWPPAATPWLHAGSDRVQAVGALSRFAPAASRVVPPGRAVALHGTGGDAVPGTPRVPGWAWSDLGGNGRWYADPWPALRSASVVVSHCGQNAVAEIAAARRPAILIPQPRPFDEQRHTARALRALELPAVVLDGWPADDDWPALLDRAASLDGADWHRWNDGGAAARVAAMITSLIPEGVPA